jgi:hypothetical protein
LKENTPLIPAQAGIQCGAKLGPRFRGDERGLRYRDDNYHPPAERSF